jgi:hypothetical protein
MRPVSRDVRFPVGSRVEFLGADDPGAHVWRGPPRCGRPQPRLRPVGDECVRPSDPVRILCLFAPVLSSGLAVLAPRSGGVWHILVQTEYSTVVGPQHTDQIVVSLGLTNVG